LPASSTRPIVLVSAVGFGQIISWGCSYYLLAVLAEPIMAETGWSLTGIVSGLSLGFLVAALVSRKVGRTIDRIGGRLVLAGGAALLGTGLTVIALAPALIVFLAGWVLIGTGMGACLYDAAFSTMGKIFGAAARRPITWLTLFGGFASTVCWPLSAYLTAHVGWRGTCLFYAAIELAVVVPLYLWLLPKDGGAALARSEPANGVHPQPVTANVTLFVLLASAVALCSLLTTLLSVHLLTLLKAGGLATASAVAFGALIGPSQVTARAIEMVLARYYHPLWTLFASTTLMSVGITGLWLGGIPVALTLLFYGAGLGLISIARGTVPLGIFGPIGYATLMGRLAAPSLAGQALGPWLGAMLIDAGGASLTLAVVSLAAIASVALTVTLAALVPAKSQS
jgi:MFS family permease